MNAVTLLPPLLAKHLEAILDQSDITPIPVQSWAELHDAVRKKPVDVTIVDPTFSGGLDTAQVVALLEQYPSVPAVVYTVASPQALKAVAELSKRGLQHVLLFRYDDSPRRVQEVLERLPGYRLSTEVLEEVQRVSGLFSRIPVALVRAVEQLFQQPHGFSGAADLARAAGMPVVKMYRRFAAAGLRQPKKLFIAARLLRAHAYMRDPGYSIEDVALKLGYSHPRIFARHAIQVLELRPTKARHRLNDEEIVKRLVDYITGDDDTAVEVEGDRGEGSTLGDNDNDIE